MRRVFASILLSIATLLLALPMPAGAQSGPACDCWCETSKFAQLKGKTIAEACSAACASDGNAMIVCAQTLDQHPDTGLFCFTKKQCTSFKSPDGKITGEFQDDAPRCSRERGYCFPINSEGISLSIPLGAGVITVTDLGDYIEKAYQFLLGVSVTIAIVLLMIGGLRYILAAQTGETAKAKGMIQNAVIGLVLLMGAYVILFTVNPQLVKLQVPSMPMPRNVALTGGFSCEELIEKKFTIGDKNSKPITSGKCGDKGVIIKNEAGVEQADGSLCSFRGSVTGKDCNGEAGKLCAIQPDGKGICTRCEEVVSDSSRNPGKVPPSAAICSTLSRNVVMNNEKLVSKEQCFYTKDINAISSGGEMLAFATAAIGTAAAAFVLSGGTAAVGAVGAASGVVGTTAAAVSAGSIIVSSLWSGTKVTGALLVAGYADDVATGTCAMVPIVCNTIKNCEQYESLKVQNEMATGTTITSMTHLQPGHFMSGEVTLKLMCETDPCGVEQKIGKKCAFVPGTLLDSCITPGAAQKRFDSGEAPAGARE